MKVKMWDYQFERRRYPWAICAILEFPRGSPEKKKVALDVYCETIPNKAHLVRLESKRYESADELRDTLTDILAAFSEISERDAHQLERFSHDILAKE